MRKYQDYHLKDTCRGCWRQRCDCKQATDAQLVVLTLLGIAAFVVAVLSLAGTVGLLGG